MLTPQQREYLAGITMEELVEELNIRQGLVPLIIQFEVSRIDAATKEQNNILIRDLAIEYCRGIGKNLIMCGAVKCFEVKHPNIMSRGFTFATTVMTPLVNMGAPPSVKNDLYPADDMLIPLRKQAQAAEQAMDNEALLRNFPAKGKPT